MSTLRRRLVSYPPINQSNDFDSMRRGSHPSKAATEEGTSLAVDTRRRGSLPVNQNNVEPRISHQNRNASTTERLSLGDTPTGREGIIVNNVATQKMSLDAIEHVGLSRRGSCPAEASRRKFVVHTRSIEKCTTTLPQNPKKHTEYSTNNLLRFFMQINLMVMDEILENLHLTLDDGEVYLYMESILQKPCHVVGKSILYRVLILTTKIMEVDSGIKCNR